MAGMLSFLQNPAVFYTIVVSLFFVLLAYCFHSGLQKERGFAFFLFLFCFVGRMPIAISPQSFDWDEDQFVVSAWSLQEYPVFFKSTECGSSGPLNIYPLVIPSLFGFEISIGSSRIIGNFLIAIALVFSFWSLRMFGVSKNQAQLAILPLATFLALVFTLQNNRMN